MSRVLLAVALASLSACTGDVPPPGGPIDAATATGDGAIADAKGLSWVDAPPGQGNNIPCDNPVSPVPNLGNHYPGKNCLLACHNGNHDFTLAGTLYTNATG